MRVLNTGSGGLIGSEAVRYFDRRASRVYGIDNRLRPHPLEPPERRPEWVERRRGPGSGRPIDPEGWVPH